MKFGSRMDVFLPPGIPVQVKKGDRVVAGRDDPGAVDPGMSRTTCRRRRRPSGADLRRGVFLLPSLFTVANLFCGWACVVYAMRGEFHTAAPFIGFAVVLDMLDGRIARMTGSSSAFGVEFDSMADLISFGMAPAALTFQWGLQPLGRLGWAVGLPVSGGGGRAAGALQHPARDRQALLRRHAESVGRRRPGGDDLLLSATASPNAGRRCSRS